MKVTYWRGKKLLGSQTIEARYRLVFYASDGCTINTATLWEDGTTSCNCKGWQFRKKCKHSIRALTITADVDETGERPEPIPAVPEEPVQRTTPFRRRTRSVDT